MLELLAASEEPLRDIGINPWAVGGIALGIFVVAVLIVTAFGKGREHT
jgi:hypothetical protein